uniref:Uncharacterized protein n=1 Tax=Oryza sativa subsp. japonica TaxID=39947 RepID=Q6K808_ORYSJ|nr:hypothetical protein [Oryza sativa Japonica Group]
MVGGVESGGKEARESGKEVGWEDLATVSLEKGEVEEEEEAAKGPSSGGEEGGADFWSPNSCPLV